MASFGASIVAMLVPYVCASAEYGMSVMRCNIADVIRSIGVTLEVPESLIRTGSRNAVRIAAGYSDELPAEIVVILALRVLKIQMLDATFFKSLHSSIRALAFQSECFEHLNQFTLSNVFPLTMVLNMRIQLK